MDADCSCCSEYRSDANRVRISNSLALIREDGVGVMGAVATAVWE